MNSRQAREVLGQAVNIAGDLKRIGLTCKQETRAGLALEGMGLRQIARLEKTSDNGVERSLKSAGNKAFNYIEGT